MEEKIVGARQHELISQNRGVGNIARICDMISSDENAVVPDTDMRLLTIKSKKLHMGRLTPEKGEVDIEGTTDSIVYSSNGALRKLGESLSTRLLKQEVSSANGRIQYETWLMVLSSATGAWLMLAYDTLRVFRLVIRHGLIWTGIEGFLYQLYVGLVTLILLYEQNDGMFRVCVIGGVFIGVILYGGFISRVFFKCLERINKCLGMTINRNKPGEVCSREQSEVGD